MLIKSIKVYEQELGFCDTLSWNENSREAHAFLDSLEYVPPFVPLPPNTTGMATFSLLDKVRGSRVGAKHRANEGGLL